GNVHAPGAAVDRDIGDAGHVACEILVPGEAEATTVNSIALDVGLPASLPAGLHGSRFDHCPASRVLQMPQPELDRINPRRPSHLIQKGFKSKDVAISPESAQCRGA